MAEPCLLQPHQSAPSTQLQSIAAAAVPSSQAAALPSEKKTKKWE
jgi:hypothetical protein